MAGEFEIRRQVELPATPEEVYDFVDERFLGSRTGDAMYRSFGGACPERVAGQGLRLVSRP